MTLHERARLMCRDMADLIQGGRWYHGTVEKLIYANLALVVQETELRCKVVNTKDEVPSGLPQLMEAEAK